MIAANGLTTTTTTIIIIIRSALLMFSSLYSDPGPTWRDTSHQQGTFMLPGKPRKVKPELDVLAPITPTRANVLAMAPDALEIMTGNFYIALTTHFIGVF